MDNNSKYLTKVIVLSIIVIINIICIIAVISTVGKTIKDLSKNIEGGKVVASEFSPEEDYTTDSSSEQEEVESLDASSLFKLLMADKNVRKSLVLLAFALILLGVAVVVFIKIK